jgi:predicted nucleic acid-binding protein
MIIVSDTSPLSHLAKVAQLSLLHQLYGTVIIPDTVANELQKADAEEREIAELLTLSWIRIYQVQNQVLVEELINEADLDEGEAEAIVLAIEVKAQRLLIDERLGRKEAKKRGVSVVGVLGILVAAKTEGLIVAVKPILDDLIVRANFWISKQLYAEVLKTVGE